MIRNHLIKNKILLDNNGINCPPGGQMKSNREDGTICPPGGQMVERPQGGGHEIEFGSIRQINLWLDKVLLDKSGNPTVHQVDTRRDSKGHLMGSEPV